MAPRWADPSEVLRRGDTATAALVILTDGTETTAARVRTSLKVALADQPLSSSLADLTAAEDSPFTMLRRMANIAVILCLIIAGCSVAVSVAGGLLDRRRPFTLLQLSGVPIGHLYRTILLEAAIPLLVGMVISLTEGFLGAALIVSIASDANITFPGADYYAMVAGGLLAALAISGVSLPLVKRMTEPRALRTE